MGCVIKIKNKSVSETDFLNHLNKIISINKLFEENPNFSSQIYEALGFKTDKKGLIELTHYSRNNQNPLDNFQKDFPLYTSRGESSEYKDYGKQFNYIVKKEATIKSLLDFHGKYGIDLDKHDEASKGLQPYHFNLQEIQAIRKEGVDILIDDWGEYVILNPNSVVLKEQQKQQAQQLYSQYLDTIGAEKGIENHIDGFKGFVASRQSHIPQLTHAVARPIVRPTDGYNYGIPVVKDQDDITFWKNQEVLSDMSFKDKQNQKVENEIVAREKTRVRDNPQVEYSWEKSDSENVRVGSIVKYEGEIYRITDSKAGKFKLKQSDASGEIIPNGNNVVDVASKDIDQVRGKFSKIINNFEYTVDDIADDIYDAFFAYQEPNKSLGLEQARAIAVVYDALAKKLSKREGISPAAWWERHLQSIRFSRFEDFVKDYKKGALTQKQTNIALQYIDDQIEIYNKVINDPYTDENVIPELEAKLSELEEIRSKIENNDVYSALQELNSIQKSTEQVSGSQQELSQEEDNRIKKLGRDVEESQSKYVNKISSNKYEATNPFTNEKVIFDRKEKALQYVFDEAVKARTKSGRLELTKRNREQVGSAERVLLQTVTSITKGATTARLDNGKRLILAFESSDVTTALHELMHFITPFLNQNEASFILSEYNKTFPNKNAVKFNENVHEWLAQSWEEYMRQGPQKIQNPLRDVLNKISDWFRGIYKNFILYNQDNKTVINLSPEMRDFFDQLLSDEEENVGNIVSNIQTELDGTFTQTGLSSKKDRDKFLKYLTTMVLSTNIPFDLLWENSRHYFSAKGFTKEEIQSIYDNNPDIKFHTSRFGFRAVQDKNLKKLPILDQIKTEFEVKSNVQTETQAERIISALQFVYPDDWVNKAINIVSKDGYPIELINNDGEIFSYTPTLTDRGVIGQKLVKTLTLEAKRNPPEANRYYGLISDMMDAVMTHANDVGRALQSFKLWSNMDADGFVYHAAKVLRRLDKKALQKYDAHIDTIIEGLTLAKKSAYDQTKVEFEDIDFDETLFQTQTQNVIDKLAEIVKKRKNVTNDEATKIARDIVNAYDKNFKKEYEKFRNGSSTFVKNLMKTADEVTGSSLSRRQIEDMVREKLNYKNKLSDEVINEVVKMAKRLENIPEDSDLLKTQEVHKILEYISDNVGNDVKEITGVAPEKMGWALWYASILSSTGTQILNTMANIFKAIFDNTFSSIYTYVNLKNVDGADRFRIALSNWNALLKQLMPYLQESKARNEFKDILFKGYKSTNTSVKWFESSILEQRGKNLEFPTNLKEIENFSAYFAKFVPRLMSAVDGYFYWANYHGRLRQIQMKSAYDTGLRGQALSDAVSEGIYGKKAKSLALQTAELELKPKGKFLLDTNGNPFTDADIRRRADEILERDYVENWGTNEQSRLAVDFAQRATFTNEPEGFWGEISRAISRAHNSDNKLLAYGSKLIVPFTRIVANVLDEQLQYGVVGSISTATKSLKKIPLSEIEHYKLQRGLAGMIFLIGGSIMASAFAQNFGDDEDDPNKIRLWGEGPKDFNVRTQLAVSGWKPYTIQIGNKYISYKEYPIGLMMAFIGNMFDYIRFSKNPEEEFGNKSQIEIGLRLQFSQLIQSPETILSASFISGLSNFFENIILAAKEENPELAMSKAVSYFTQQLGSSAPLVPVVGPIVTIPTSNLAKQAYKVMFDNRWLSSSDPDGFERAKKVFIRSLLGQPFFTDAEPYRTSLGDEIYNDKTGLILRMVNFGKSDEIYDLLLNKNVYIPSMGFGTMIDGERIWDTNRDLFQELAAERGRLIKEYIYDNLEVYQYMSREEILNDLQLNGLDSSKKNSFLKRAKRNLGY